MATKSNTRYADYCEEKVDDEIKRLYIAALDAVDVHWIGQLPSSDVLVLLFIIKRTIRFGKQKVAIPVRHFREGVRKGDSSEVIISGLKMTHETVTAALGRLRDLGLIDFERKHKGNTYELTRVGVEIDALFAPVVVEIGEDDMGKLPIPRGKKRCAEEEKEGTDTRENGEKGGVRKSAWGGAEIRMRKHRNNNVRKEEHKTLPPAEAVGRIRRVRSYQTAVEAIAASASTTSEKRKTTAARAAARPGRALTQREFVAMWEESVLRHHPAVPAVGVTVSQWSTLKHYVAKMPDATSMQELVDYATENWSTIINTQMHWHREVKGGRIGDAPEAGFFMLNLRHFLQSFANAKVSGGKIGKALAAVEDNQLERENAELRRQVAALSKEREKLSARDRQNQSIMREMERKMNSRETTGVVPLNKTSLRPIDD